MFFASLMGRELTIVNNQGNRTLLFITKDADFMRLIKKHFHGKTEICSQNVKVCADSLKKYNVSFSFHVIYVDISCHKFISIFFFCRNQNFDNMLNAVNCASEIGRKEIINLIAKARQCSLLISENWNTHRLLIASTHFRNLHLIFTHSNGQNHQYFNFTLLVIHAVLLLLLLSKSNENKIYK